MSTILLVISGTLIGAVGIGISVLYATYGEVITERAGRINLGVEGSMLMGAAFGFIVTVETGQVFIGVLGGALAGGLLSAIHAYLIIYRGTNQLATGLAITFFRAGFTAFAGRSYVGAQINGLTDISIPLLSQIPLLGKALFQQDIMAYSAYALGPILWFILMKTRWGLSLRAVGDSVEVAFAAGRKPDIIQSTAVIIGGVFAGLGGAQLALAFTLQWSEGMTSGRGFIAVALVIFGTWSPLRAMAGPLLFGGAIGLQLLLQAIAVPISPFILDMFPYIITLAVLSVWTGAALRAMPEGLISVMRG